MMPVELSVGHAARETDHGQDFPLYGSLAHSRRLIPAVLTSAVLPCAALDVLLNSLLSS